MEKKSNATSIKYRTVGNKLFRKGEFLFAAIAYNKVNLFITFLQNTLIVWIFLRQFVMQKQVRN